MAENLHTLGAALLTALDALLHAWFPGLLDQAYGGYRCDLDHRWRPHPPNQKMLEYQARTLRFVARAASHRPHLLPAAEQGFRFLADVMWDAEYGGWYRLVDERGVALEQGSKHGHGMAYAISACVWYYRLTGEQQALDLAWQAFQWLDDNAYDREAGGYFSYYQRDGARILDPARAPHGRALLDPLGNPIGSKEANTTIDLMEALWQLYESAPHPRVGQRAQEMLNIVMQHVLVKPGGLHLAFTRHWQPLPHLTNYAMCLQTACLLLSISRLLEPAGMAEVLDMARTLVDHMLVVAWDGWRGGFHQAGWVFGAAEIEQCRIFVPDKLWWCQAEGLRALLLLADRFPHCGYDARAIQLWHYIDCFVIDHRHGGWRLRGRDSQRYRRRAAKASRWKDPCHEGFALLTGIELWSKQSSS